MILRRSDSLFNILYKTHGRSPFICAVFFAILGLACGVSQVSNHLKSQPQNHDISIDVCPGDEPWCVNLDEKERLALEAITVLFRQLDDDQDGNVNMKESTEFLREELKYGKNTGNRQKAFHRDDDEQVSVRELWDTWIKSEVHNWTVVQTRNWIRASVGLSEMAADKFLRHGVNGTMLPILAVNHNNYLGSVLGIKDSITKQRVVVKAMDIVLFGPAIDNTNYLKDIVLTTAVVVLLFGSMILYRRYQASQEDLNNMVAHMADLHKAEELLRELQSGIERSDQERQAVTDHEPFDGEGPEELVRLREENQVLRNELHRAESELQDKCWVAPHALQHWLQYTYELELKSYNKKKSSAERQLKQAKEACDKLKKKRSSLMGAFVSTHGRSIDDVDKAILEARTALTEITHELQERMHRWKQIEVLVGCQIMNNNGLQYLDNLLKVYGRPQSYSHGPGSVISNSQDDIDDDTSSIYSPSTVHKLISTSTFLMFPGHQVPYPYPPASTTRIFSHQQSPSNYSSVVNIAGGYGGNNRSYEVSVKENKINGPSYHNSITCTNQSCENPSDMSSTINANSVGGNTSSTNGSGSSNFPAMMARSRSVTSMASLRDRTISREPSSQESSNGDADMLSEGPDCNGLKDRRVTFRADRRAPTHYRIFGNLIPAYGIITNGSLSNGLLAQGRTDGPTLQHVDRRPHIHIPQYANRVDVPDEEESQETPEINEATEQVREERKINPRHYHLVPSIHWDLVNGPVADQTNQIPIKTPKLQVWRNTISSLVRKTDKRVPPVEVIFPNQEASIKKSKSRSVGSFKRFFSKPKIQPSDCNPATARGPLPDCIL